VIESPKNMTRACPGIASLVAAHPANNNVTVLQRRANECGERIGSLFEMSLDINVQWKDDKFTCMGEFSV
jgi:hypothetical protein